MKKIYPIILIACTPLFKSQSQDLAKLATGENVRFNAIYDRKGENLDGYFALYDNGATANDKKKFEYFILDKNLNIVANKEFEAEKIVASYVAYTNVRGKLTLSPRLVYNYMNVAGGAKKLVFPSDKEVDFITNEMKERNEKCYENDQLTDCPSDKTLKESRQEEKDEKKTKGFVTRSYVWETKYDNYLVVKYDDYEKYTQNDKMILFSSDSKEIWSFSFNKDGNKKIEESLRILTFDEHKIFTILRRTENKKLSFTLIVFDAKNGEILKKEPIEPLLNSFPPEINKETTLNYLSSMYTQIGDVGNSKSFDDKYVLVGRIYETKNIDYTTLNGQGYVRMIIDKNTMNISFNQFNYGDDLAKFIPSVKSYGRMEDGYYLAPRDFYFMKNGSIGILTEMYKDQGSYSANKNKDFYYFYTDKDFKIIGTKQIPKTLSKYEITDYLFSQNIKGGDDVVFFYQDVVKDESRKKKRQLYINTLIDNQFKQEVIPIGTEENTIIPYVAKEGYILLNEYNKKEKYNQVRLEKLNY